MDSLPVGAAQMGNCAVTTLKQCTQRRDDASNICRFLPKLTVNGQFMRDSWRRSHLALR